MTLFNKLVTMVGKKYHASTVEKVTQGRSANPSSAPSRSAVKPLPDVLSKAQISFSAKGSWVNTLKPAFQAMLKKLSKTTCIMSIEVVDEDQSAASRTRLPAALDNRGLKMVPGLAAPPLSGQGTPNLQAAGTSEKDDAWLVPTAALPPNSSNCPAHWIPASCAAETLRRFGDGMPSSSGTQAEHPLPPTIESPRPSPEKALKPAKKGYWCAVWYHAPKRKWVACVPDYIKATLNANRSCQTVINTAVQSLASQVKLDQKQEVAALPFDKKEAQAHFHKALLYESDDLPLVVLLGRPSWMRIRPPTPCMNGSELLIDVELAVAATLV